MVDAPTLVDPGRDRAKRVRRVMGRALRSCIEDHGDTLAGFALVSWDMLGGVHTTYLTDVGPISECLMPTYVHDTLNRHVAAVMVRRNDVTKIDGDA